MRYALLAAVAMAVGCYTPTTIQKTVTVEKDPTGQVLKRIEVECVTQEIAGKTIQLEYIKVEEAEEKPYSGD